MNGARRIVRVAVATAVAALACAQYLPGTVSSFTASTTTPENTVSAVPDWTPPSVSRAVLQKAAGGAPAKVHAGGSFYLYAAVTDSGSPASGVGAVTGDVSAIATVATATLNAGTYSVGGVSYGYRSAQLTVKPALANGVYELPTRAADAAGNTSPAVAVPVTADNTPFIGVDVTTTDVAGDTGLIQAGDRIAFAYNRAPEPASILAAWDGTATGVLLRVVDGGVYGLSSTQDLVGPVDAAGNALGVGYATLNGDYVSNNKAVVFAGSSMVLSGAAATLTLGTPDTPGFLKDVNTNQLPTWTPSAQAIDQFGNAAGTATLTQSGGAKKQF